MRSVCGRLAAAVVIGVLCLSEGVALASVQARPPTRLVVLKFDGLPPQVVEGFLHRTDPRTGRSTLPWIERLFYDDGVRIENFYSRGTSLTAPSWAIIDTGQPGIIKGNFEYERHTGETHSYLDYLDFYYSESRGRTVYPSIVEALDRAGAPLLSDAFVFERRESGLQLLRRGAKWADFLKVGLKPIRGPVAQRFGELLIGVDYHHAFALTAQETLLAALKNPQIEYVDYYNANVDVLLHEDNSAEGRAGVLREVDRVIGQAYAAVAESGTADRTVIAVVSDHGMTTEENGPYSQGVNLATYLARRELGAHHLLTREGPLSSYSLRRSLFRPWVSAPPVTPSRESLYLADRVNQVTCALDYDGNERAAISLRNPDLNKLQLLIGALRHRELAPRQQEAVSRAAIRLLERNRDTWAADARALREELAALARARVRHEAELARLEPVVAFDRRASERRAPMPPADMPAFGGQSALNTSNRALDLHQRARELRAAVWQASERMRAYGSYTASLEARCRIETVRDLLAPREDLLLPPRDLGDAVSVAGLQAYPIGLRGIVLDDRGDLDEAASFATLDYFATFASLRIRNAMNRDSSAAPVEFSVARLPVAETVREARAAGLLTATQAAAVTTALFLYGDETRQLLLFGSGRGPSDGEIALAPVASLRMDGSTGRVAFTPAPWRPGLPLRLFEDPDLDTGGRDRASWLSTFHGDREWLAATHRTREGLGASGLAEVFSQPYLEAAPAPDATVEDDALMRRFALRLRRGLASDLLLHAAPHWNFDLKDFNPGGNHGGFGRQAMRAVFWLWGGRDTRVRSGPLSVAAPYDGLDVAPTLFEAAGLTVDGVLPEKLLRRGFRPFPGRIIREVLEDATEPASPPEPARPGAT